jgi:hypothetical protein
MPLLGKAKQRIGQRLGSGATAGEGAQNMLCAYLAAGVLTGLAVNGAFGLWWADPAVALGIAALALNEGREAWRGEGCCVASPIRDERRVAETIARIASRPLDRSRPLWELYLVHGLAGGRIGMLSKQHRQTLPRSTSPEPSSRPRSHSRCSSTASGNITVLSYCDHADVGIVADADQVQDGWPLMGAMTAELDALKAAARQDQPT